MPKAKTTKTKPNKTHNKKSKKIKILVAIAIILLAFIGISATIEHLQQKELEDKFAILSRDFDGLKLQLNKEIPGTSFHKKEYCYRESGKFHDGPLRCAIEISSSFLRNEGVKKAQGIISSNAWQNIGPDSSSVQDFKYKDSSFFCRSFTEEHDKRNSFKFFCNQKSSSSFYPYRGD